jgi:hypothetical protein
LFGGRCTARERMQNAIVYLQMQIMEKKKETESERLDIWIYDSTNRNREGRNEKFSHVREYVNAWKITTTPILCGVWTLVLSSHIAGQLHLFRLQTWAQSNRIIVISTTNLWVNDSTIENNLWKSNIFMYKLYYFLISC